MFVRLKMAHTLRSSSRIYRLLGLLMTLCAVSACGGGGIPIAAEDCSVCGGTFRTVTGVIASTDENAQFEGWVIALIEKKTNLARVAEIESGGEFSFDMVRKGEDQTLVLLNSAYEIVSNIEFAASGSRVGHYFQLRRSNLPELTFDGSKLSFSSLSGVSPSTESSQVSNESQAALLLTNVDTDSDGVPNNEDSDIDGDSIINLLDDDDDGDGIGDYFDTDANGNGVLDIEEGNIALVENSGISYANMEWQKNLASTLPTSQMKFSIRMSENVGPKSIQVRGSSYLLNDAFYQDEDEDGEDIQALWSHRLLRDLGKSEDGIADDRVFAMKVQLSKGKAPRPKEMLFFQLRYGTRSNPWFVEYPFVFSDLTPGDIMGSINLSTLTVTKTSVLGSKRPFGEESEYFWSVQLYENDSDILVYNSDLLDANLDEFKIPSYLVVSGEDYYFQISAQSISKFPGNASTYRLFSKKYSFTAL